MTDRQLSNPEPHPDAALLALWGDYVAIWRAKEALPVLEGHADDDQKEPLYEKIFCLENRIADVPALSVEGLTVKLRILFPSMVSVNGLDQALFCGGPEPEWRLEDENFAVRLAWSTLQDAERMIGPALSEPASGSLGALWMRDALHSLPLDVLHRMERTIGAIAAVSRARRALRPGQYPDHLGFRPVVSPRRTSAGAVADDGSAVGRIFRLPGPARGAARHSGGSGPVWFGAVPGYLRVAGATAAPGAGIPAANHPLAGAEGTVRRGLWAARQLPDQVLSAPQGGAGGLSRRSG